MLPKVSVVIPFYNCPFVDQAIQSVLNQTYANIEIVVVDDGSTLHLDKIAPYRDRICYLGKANGGTASALNHGIGSATGEYVAWLSSDDLFHPDKIARQLSFMLARDAWVSFTNYDLIDENSMTTASFAGPCFSSVWDFYEAFFTSVPVHGCTVMARKEMFLHMGYFNEGLLYTQDYEMWMRVVLNNFDFYYLHDSLTLFRWHGANGTIRHQSRMAEEVQYIRAKFNPLLEGWLARLKSGQ
ncbi:glycosyltransferase [Paenibacillus sp. HWE-109]|uniref:glycosyltransferase n=1 Tax=Paenibacillus sp. HWE-109 TaxID=1306526 RepID=UPI001EE132BF|nr:glycosyltransferase [Paenibacillus sp. HWE-109]UKS27629.1 glycosyltransferase [Paenibacillus sp. HWE-109]